ncbi:MAG: carbon-nitrogen hydrolase family protein [Thaumarchaeota archaeon]|nr:carbon-nitrogen hydrolase family protein [Nitrososphaerota archaeon]
MKVTVCELGDSPAEIAEDWEGLKEHVKKESSELVLLPELPFFPWPKTRKGFSLDSWEQSVLSHDQWVARLGELGPAVVIGTRPVMREGRRLNEGFTWTEGSGYMGVHSKYYLPNEEGFWEADWYDRGDGAFEPTFSGEAKLGFLICSELWSMSHAREYGKAGVHIIVNPRTSGRLSLDKWLTGGRAAAIVSGSYSLSSNRISRGDGGLFGGRGWVVDPDGVVLATTTAEAPYASVDVKLEAAAAAKKTYPRYCLD